MNSPEEYENVIALMKKALEFYADPKNYTGTMAMIDLDEQGSQARFALKQAEDLIEQNLKMQEDYDRLMAAGEQLMATQDTADPEKLIKAFKVFENEKGISESFYTDEERKHVNEMKKNAKNVDFSNSKEYFYSEENMKHINEMKENAKNFNNEDNNI